MNVHWLWGLAPLALCAIAVLVLIRLRVVGTLIVAVVVTAGCFALLHAAATDRPAPEAAFAAVEYIMRDVQYGWLFRYVVKAAGFPISAMFFGMCFLSAWPWLQRSKTRPPNP